MVRVRIESGKRPLIDFFSKYFSVDGGLSPLAEFSTGSTYEASHWKDNLNLGLMDPTAGVGELLAFSENDLRALDVIGYDRVVPEPSTGVCGLAAVGLAVLGRRRFHRTAGMVP